MNLLAVKILLVAANIILFGLGSCLLTVGYVLEFQTEVFTGYLAPILKAIPAGGGTGADIWTLYNYATISFIVVGSVMVLIGVTGCLLATCPNKQAATVYLSTLGMVILSQATGSAILVYTDIDSTLVVNLRNSLLTKYAGDEAVDEYSEAWNYVFIEFDCCAVETYGEFDITVRWNRKKHINGNITKVLIPETCCKMAGDYPDQGPPYDSNCTVNPTQENSHFNKGCYGPLQDFLRYYHKLMILCESSPLPLECLEANNLEFQMIDESHENLLFLEALQCGAFSTEKLSITLFHETPFLWSTVIQLMVVFVLVGTIAVASLCSKSTFPKLIVAILLAVIVTTGFRNGKKVACILWV